MSTTTKASGEGCSKRKQPLQTLPASVTDEAAKNKKGGSRKGGDEKAKNLSLAKPTTPAPLTKRPTNVAPAPPPTTQRDQKAAAHFAQRQHSFVRPISYPHPLQQHSDLPSGGGQSAAAMGISRRPPFQPKFNRERSFVQKSKAVPTVTNNRPSTKTLNSQDEKAKRMSTPAGGQASLFSSRSRLSCKGEKAGAANQPSTTTGNKPLAGKRTAVVELVSDSTNGKNVIRKQEHESATNTSEQQPKPTINVKAVLNPTAKEFVMTSSSSEQTETENITALNSQVSVSNLGDLSELLKASKSMSAGDAATLIITDAAVVPVLKKPQLLDRAETEHVPEMQINGCLTIDAFPAKMHHLLYMAMSYSNNLTVRSIMDLVSQIFDCLIQGKVNGETAADVCMRIIEVEGRETFLESLLNACQEWYYVLKGNKWRLEVESAQQANNTLWNTRYMDFLCELYKKLKRNQWHLVAKNEGVPPKLAILALLGDCFHLILSSRSFNDTREMDCLFNVLTTVGWDLSFSQQTRMSVLVTLLRDAFLTADALPSIKKTLLHLIELQASNWQLPTSAVLYFYPG